MLRQIDKCKEVTIDGVTFPVNDIIPNGDPLNQFCKGCGVKNQFHIEAEVSQLGFIGDCFVILCTCKKCEKLQGWRYFMMPEETL